MADIAVLDAREKVMAGIALTSSAYFLFSLQDASIKLLVAGISVWQVLFFRSASILAGCALIGGRRLFIESARSPILVPMLLRSFLVLSAWLCYYSAAAFLQLAELTTIYFAAPIIVTVLSIPLLGEKVPPLRWFAVLLGFAGVFVACDPSRLGLSVPVLLVLASAALWALSIVLMRKIAEQERTMVQLLLANVFFLLIAGPPLFALWRTPDPGEIALLVAVGVLGGGGQFLLYESMKRAPISIIAPLEYTSLVWAFALGLAIWGDMPRREVFVGAAVIIAAGLILVAGERRRRPAA